MTNVSIKFTAKLLANATTAMVNASNAIDMAQTSAENPTNKWAAMAAAGLSANSVTKEDIGNVLCKAANVDVPSNLPSASRSRWFALSKVIKNDGLNRLIAGEALFTVSRSYEATQKQAPKSKGRGSKKLADATQLLSFNDSVAALLHWINTATANTDKAVELAKSEKLVELLAAIAKLEKAATVGATKAKAATAKAKAEKAATVKANAKLAKSKAKPANVVVPLPKGRATVTTKLAKAA